MISFEQMLYCFAAAGTVLFLVSLLTEYTVKILKLNNYISEDLLEETTPAWFFMNFVMEFLFYVAVPTIGYSFLYLVMPFDGVRAGMAASMFALVLGAVPVIIGLSVRVKLSMPYLMFVLLSFFLKLAGSLIVIGYIYSW